MRKLHRLWISPLILILILVLVAAGCGSQAPQTEDGKFVVRVGYFPNITHAQAVIGLADGTFARALGPDVVIDPKVFNAGPSEIEALMAGAIDLGYIGPVPALNGYAKSNGGLKIVAGTTNGGAVMVVREDAGINQLTDLKGKRIAVPQFGNTQDLNLRHILKTTGLVTADRGGDVTIFQVANPDILTLFVKKELDAALVPEPWGARLEQDGNGKVLLDWKEVWRDGNYPTALVIARTEFLEQHPEMVEKWLTAHLELTNRIATDPKTAAAEINEQLRVLTGNKLPLPIIETAFTRMLPSCDPVVAALDDFVSILVENGYLKEKIGVEQALDLRLMNKVLQENQQPEIQSK